MATSTEPLGPAVHICVAFGHTRLFVLSNSLTPMPRPSLQPSVTVQVIRAVVDGGGVAVGCGRGGGFCVDCGGGSGSVGVQAASRATAVRARAYFERVFTLSSLQ